MRLKDHVIDKNVDKKVKYDVFDYSYGVPAYLDEDLVDSLKKIYKSGKTYKYTKGDTSLEAPAWNKVRSMVSGGSIFEMTKSIVNTMSPTKS